MPAGSVQGPGRLNPGNYILCKPNKKMQVHVSKKISSIIIRIIIGSKAREGVLLGFFTSRKGAPKKRGLGWVGVTMTISSEDWAERVWVLGLFD